MAQYACVVGLLTRTRLARLRNAAALQEATATAVRPSMTEVTIWWMWVDAAVLLVIDSQRPTVRCRYVVIRLGGLRVAHTSVWRTPRCCSASTCSSYAYSCFLCR